MHGREVCAPTVCNRYAMYCRGCCTEGREAAFSSCGSVLLGLLQVLAHLVISGLAILAHFTMSILQMVYNSRCSELLMFQNYTFALLFRAALGVT